MKARATIVAELDSRGRTVLRRLESQAPLVLRRSGEAVYVVAAAGGPLGGDELTLDIEVGERAQLCLRSVAATVAQPSAPAARSRMTIRAALGRGSRLSLLPEPVVVAQGARHAMTTEVSMPEDAWLELREEVILGRHGEVGGHILTTTVVSVAGRPVFCQSVDVDGAREDRRATIGDARAFGSLVAVNPLWRGELPAVRSGDGFAVLPLAVYGVVAIALGADSNELRARLDSATDYVSPLEIGVA